MHWLHARDVPQRINICIPASSAVDCGDPGTPTNGKHTLSSTTYSFVVTYTCDEGYILQGSNSRTCQSNGEWSGSVPQCTRKLVKWRHCHFPFNALAIDFPTFILFYTVLCSRPCQNGGTCTGINTCTCTMGWTGKLCESGKYVVWPCLSDMVHFMVYTAVPCTVHWKDAAVFCRKLLHYKPGKRARLPRSWPDQILRPGYSFI